ncbi:MAG: hypothetical protein CVU64_23700, partial [Deltaproteobacteria bacterium HGW-Deltaproteobacteria-21]
DTGADKTYLSKRAIRYRRRIQGATKKRALAHFSDDLKSFTLRVLRGKRWGLTTKDTKSTKGCVIQNEEFPAQ